jgi:myo-inositol-1(or 4)-monophosphatase
MVKGEAAAVQVDRQVLVDAEAVCVQAIQEAGALLLSYFRRPLEVEFKEKGQQSPVTEADRRSEALLRDALSHAFPGHGIIGEEAEDAVNPEADYLWFLDPLDGTTNFAAGLPAFAVSMGLCFRGVPVLGVVAVPWEGPGGTIFRAHAGGGAYCNNEPMQAAGDDVPDGTRLASTPGWMLHQYRVQRGAKVQRLNVRSAGSIAYELAYAARGTFQLTVISGARLWDMVAGAVLVQEAGGAVLFCNGKARRWDAWEAFQRQALSAPFGQDAAALRKLHVYMLAGNAQIVRERAGQIALRRLPGPLAKLRRRGRKLLGKLKGGEAGPSQPDGASHTNSNPNGGLENGQERAVHRHGEGEAGGGGGV